MYCLAHQDACDKLGRSVNSATNSDVIIDAVNHRPTRAGHSFMAGDRL